MSSSVLPWKWVIESLADIPDVDISILSDLIDRFPDVLDDSSGALRERVTLRCLEECSGMACGETPPAVATNAPSTSASAAKIDAALTCEEVLRLKVATANDDVKGKACLDDADLHQFILLKRATLPKSSIELLKEKILGSYHLDLSHSTDCNDLYEVLRSGGVNPLASNNHRDLNGVRKIIRTMKHANPGRKMLAIIRKYRNFKNLANNAPLRTVGGASQKISTSQQHFVKQNASNGDSDNLERSLRSIRQSEMQNVLLSADSQELADEDCDDLPLLEQSSMPQSSSAQNLCIKCSEGGQLLNCRGHGCSRSVHESCLGLLAGVEQDGLFYCPLCSYRNVRIMYQKLKTEVREAQRKLYAFYDVGSTVDVQKRTTSAKIMTGSDKENADHQSSEHPDSFSNQQLRNSSDAQKHDGAQNAETSNGNFVRDNDQGITQNQQHKLNGEDDMICKIILPCRETNESDIHRVVQDTPMKQKNGSNREFARTNVAEDQQPMDDIGTNENGYSPFVENPSHERNGDVSVTEIRNEVCRNQLPVEEIKNVNSGDADQEQISLQASKRSPLRVEGECDHNAKRKALASQISDRFAKRSRRDKDVKIDNYQGGVENAHTGSSSRELRKNTHRQNLSLTLKRAPSRRTKLIWKPEEEEILEEAMQKIPNNEDGTIPWTKILEYGRRFLHESRTPIDLKDKWRNMQKKEAKNRS